MVVSAEVPVGRRALRTRYPFPPSRLRDDPTDALTPPDPHGHGLLGAFLTEPVDHTSARCNLLKAQPSAILSSGVI
jgi:hypothetical protein